MLILTPEQRLAILIKATDAYLLQQKNKREHELLYNPEHHTGFWRAGRIHETAMILRAIYDETEKNELPILYVIKMISLFFIAAYFAALGIKPERSTLLIWLKSATKKSGLYIEIANAYARAVLTKPDAPDLENYIDDLIRQFPTYNVIQQIIDKLNSGERLFDTFRMPYFKSQALIIIKNLFDLVEPKVTAANKAFYEIFFDQLPSADSWSDCLPYTVVRTIQDKEAEEYLKERYKKFSFDNALDFFATALSSLDKKPLWVQAVLRVITSLQKENNKDVTWESKVLLLLSSLKTFLIENDLWPTPKLTSYFLAKHEQSYNPENDDEKINIFFFRCGPQESIFAIHYKMGMCKLDDLLDVTETTEEGLVCNFLQQKLTYRTGATEQVVFQQATELGTQLRKCHDEQTIYELLNNALLQLIIRIEIKEFINSQTVKSVRALYAMVTSKPKEAKEEKAASEEKNDAKSSNSAVVIARAFAANNPANVLQPTTNQLEPWLLYLLQKATSTYLQNDLINAQEKKKALRIHLVANFLQEVTEKYSSNALPTYLKKIISWFFICAYYVAIEAQPDSFAVTISLQKQKKQDALVLFRELERSFSSIDKKILNPEILESLIEHLKTETQFNERISKGCTRALKVLNEEPVRKSLLAAQLLFDLTTDTPSINSENFIFHQLYFAKWQTSFIPYEGDSDFLWCLQDIPQHFHASIRYTLLPFLRNLDFSYDDILDYIIYALEQIKSHIPKTYEILRALVNIIIKEKQQDGYTSSSRVKILLLLSSLRSTFRSYNVWPNQNRNELWNDSIHEDLTYLTGPNDRVYIFLFRHKHSKTVFEVSAKWQSGFVGWNRDFGSAYNRKITKDTASDAGIFCDVVQKVLTFLTGAWPSDIYASAENLKNALLTCNDTDSATLLLNNAVIHLLRLAPLGDEKAEALSAVTIFQNISAAMQKTLAKEQKEDPAEQKQQVPAAGDLFKHALICAPKDAAPSKVEIAEGDITILPGTILDVIDRKKAPIALQVFK